MRAQTTQPKIEVLPGTVQSLKKLLAQITAVEAAEKEAAQFFVDEIVFIDAEEKARLKTISTIYGKLEQLERPKDKPPRTADELEGLFRKLKHEIYPEFENNGIILPSLDWDQIFKDKTLDPIKILEIFINCCDEKLKLVKALATNRRVKPGEKLVGAKNLGAMIKIVEQLNESREALPKSLLDFLLQKKFIIKKGNKFEFDENRVSFSEFCSRKLFEFRQGVSSEELTDLITFSEKFVPEIKKSFQSKWKAELGSFRNLINSKAVGSEKELKAFLRQVHSDKNPSEVLRPCVAETMELVQEALKSSATSPASQSAGFSDAGTGPSYARADGRTGFASAGASYASSNQGRSPEATSKPAAAKPSEKSARTLQDEINQAWESFFSAKSNLEAELDKVLNKPCMQEKGIETVLEKAFRRVLYMESISHMAALLSRGAQMAKGALTQEEIHFVCEAFLSIKNFSIDTAASNLWLVTHSQFTFAHTLNQAQNQDDFNQLFLICFINIDFEKIKLVGSHPKCEMKNVLIGYEKQTLVEAIFCELSLRPYNRQKCAEILAWLVTTEANFKLYNPDLITKALDLIYEPRSALVSTLLLKFKEAACFDDVSVATWALRRAKRSGSDDLLQTLKPLAVAGVDFSRAKGSDGFTYPLCNYFTLQPSADDLKILRMFWILGVDVPFIFDSGNREKDVLRETIPMNERIIFLLKEMIRNYLAKTEDPRMHEITQRGLQTAWQNYLDIKKGNFADHYCDFLIELEKKGFAIDNVIQEIIAYALILEEPSIPVLCDKRHPVSNRPLISYVGTCWDMPSPLKLVFNENAELVFSMKNKTIPLVSAYATLRRLFEKNVSPSGEVYASIDRAKLYPLFLHLIFSEIPPEKILTVYPFILYHATDAVLALVHDKRDSEGKTLHDYARSRPEFHELRDRLKKFLPELVHVEKETQASSASMPAAGPTLFSSPKTSRAEDASGESKCAKLIRGFREDYLVGLEKLGKHLTRVQKMNIEILKAAGDSKTSVLDGFPISMPSSTFNCLFLMGMKNVIACLVSRKETETYTISTNEETLAFACLRGIDFIVLAKECGAKPSPMSEKIVAFIDDPEITAAVRDEEAIMRDTLEKVLSQYNEIEDLAVSPGLGKK